MADRTEVFKATVKTVKTRNKVIGVDSGSTVTGGIAMRSRKKTEFAKRSKEILANITKLRLFLLKNRKDYIGIIKETDESGGITDSDRDKIDIDAGNYMRNCRSAISQLSSTIDSPPCSKQMTDNKMCVIEVLNNYLVSVCNLYSEQRAIRVKRIIDRKKLSYIEPESKRIESRRKSSSRTAEFLESTETEDMSMEELSMEEIMMFEEENQKLFREMNSMSDEVKQIEGKVVEISRLQEIFANKVLQQDQEIGNVNTVVIGTTENIKDASNIIRQSTVTSSRFRFWLIFILIVLSTTLLFLDWYN